MNIALITGILTFTVSFFFELNDSVFIDFKIEQELLNPFYKKWTYYEKNITTAFDESQLSLNDCLNLNAKNFSFNNLLEKYLNFSQIKSLVAFDIVLNLNCFQITSNLTNLSSTTAITSITTALSTTSNFVNSTEYFTISISNTTNSGQQITTMISSTNSIVKTSTDYSTNPNTNVTNISQQTNTSNAIYSSITNYINSTEYPASSTNIGQQTTTTTINRIFSSTNSIG